MLVSRWCREAPPGVYRQLRAGRRLRHQPVHRQRELGRRVVLQRRVVRRERGRRARSGSLIAADSGKWKVDGQVGVLNNAATRALGRWQRAALSGVRSSARLQPVYMVGNHFSGGDGSNLAFRNDTPPGNAANYNYFMDAVRHRRAGAVERDHGRRFAAVLLLPQPPMTRSRRVTRSSRCRFRTRATRRASSGLRAGQRGVLPRRQLRMSSPTPASMRDDTNWDGIKASIDPTAGTFGIDYYVVATNTWSTLVPSGTPLGNSMTNFTTLGWRLEDGVNGGSAARTSSTTSRSRSRARVRGRAGVRRAGCDPSQAKLRIGGSDTRAQRRCCHTLGVREPSPFHSAGRRFSDGPSGFLLPPDGVGGFGDSEWPAPRTPR